MLAVFALVFAGMLARAVWLQGVQAGTLEQIAARQHTETIAIPAGRGTIYDRTGEPREIGEQETIGLPRPAPRRAPALGRGRRRQALDLDLDPTSWTRSSPTGRNLRAWRRTRCSRCRRTHRSTGARLADRWRSTA